MRVASTQCRIENPVQGQSEYIGRRGAERLIAKGYATRKGADTIVLVDGFRNAKENHATEAWFLNQKVNAVEAKILALQRAEPRGLIYTILQSQRVDDACRSVGDAIRAGKHPYRDAILR